MTRRRMLAALFSCAAAVAACGSKKERKVDLIGEWVADTERLEQLYVVSNTPKGAERQRILAEVRQDMAQLKVVFTADNATLDTGTSKRTVPYQVRSVQGEMVILEGVHGDQTVQTSLMVRDGRLTWFDGSGQIEFVLRRPPS